MKIMKQDGYSVSNWWIKFITSPTDAEDYIH